MRFNPMTGVNGCQQELTSHHEHDRLWILMSKGLQQTTLNREDEPGWGVGSDAGPTPIRARGGKRLPTMADVAREAGVSTGTVSNVLSGARRVAPGTLRKVERAIRELDYRPNFAARSLMRRQTMTVGMIVPDIVNPVFAGLLSGAEDALSQAGYAVLFGSSQNRIEKERRYLETFRDRQVDGMIIDIASDTDDAELATLRAGAPIVLVDHATPAWSGDSVRSDDEHGMALAVDHLVGLGHRRIALVNGEAIVTGAVRRQFGFESRLAHHGLEPAWISSGTFTMSSGHEQAGALLASDAQATAVCAGNDVLALGALSAFLEAGIDVPGSISVVGYDDIEFDLAVMPKLSTVTQPMRAMGMAAARLLLQRFEEPEGPSQAVKLQGRLVVRESTGPPSV